MERARNAPPATYFPHISQPLGLSAPPPLPGDPLAAAPRAGDDLALRRAHSSCIRALPHLQVRYLKIIEKSGYQALPWVRYITQNGDYQLRMG